MISRLVIRADGSRDRGLGHIMRTMAVAEVAREAGLDVVYVGSPDPTVHTVLDERGFGHVAVAPDWPETIDRVDMVIVDAPTSDDDLRTVHTNAGVVGLIDDAVTRDHPVDLLIAPDLAARPPGCRMPLLFGWDHALIRAEFWQPKPNSTHGGAGLVATFGGTDPTGAGQRLIDQIGRLDNVATFASLTLIEGPGSEPVEVGEGRAAQTPITIERNPRNLAGVLADSAAVITAAGTTMLEVAAMGVAMAVVPIVAEQRVAADRMVRSGALALDLDATTGPTSLASVLDRLGDSGTRRSVAQHVHAAVDGRGAQRVFAALHEVAKTRQNR